TKNQIESVSATRLLSGSIFQGYVCFPGRDLVSFHGLFLLCLYRETRILWWIRSEQVRKQLISKNVTVRTITIRSRLCYQKVRVFSCGMSKGSAIMTFYPPIAPSIRGIAIHALFAH